MPLPLIAGPLIAAGASLLGGHMQNVAQRKQAREQMAFQERMSSTAYQRATADMKMAGINPMVAYQQGGASTPGGSQASQVDVMSPAVSSAQHASRLKTEMDLMRQDVATRRSVGMAQAGALQSESNLKAVQMKLVELEAAHSAASLTSALNSQRISGSSTGRALQWIERFRESVFGGALPVPFIFRGIGGGQSSARPTPVNVPASGRQPYRFNSPQAPKGYY